MEIIRLSKEEIRKVYNESMKEDFPLNERRPLKMIYKAIEKGEYECYGLQDKDGLAGYAFFVKHDKDYLFDYLAIDKNKRASGLGTIFLQLLKEKLSNAESIVGEVEDPNSGETEDEQKNRMRRISFYLRNGCRDTGVKAKVFGVKYRILELVIDKKHHRDEIKRLYSSHYMKMLPSSIYSKVIKIR